MISQHYRTAGALWETLTPKERGTVLFDLGLLDDLPDQVVMNSPAMERLLINAEKLTDAEEQRFFRKAKALWQMEARIKKDSDAFLRNSDEGFSDRLIVALGLQQRPLKSRALTAKLNETGSAPKNPRNLLQSLVKAGLASEQEPEEGGETLFKLTDDGRERRNQLLGLD